MFNRSCVPVLAAHALFSTPGTSSAMPLHSEPLGGAQLDVSLFYDGLSRFGDWVEMPGYGWTFAPRVSRDWRPYTEGQWAFTDEGWYWESDEEFGWATYHYGRWTNDPYYGWIWVPGTDWAPAWVSWRQGNGYTGWAPLPPRIVWQTRVGFRMGSLDIDAYIGAEDYAFVSDRSFIERGIHQRVLPADQNALILRTTTNITTYTFVNDRIINQGVPLLAIERAVGRRIPRARTYDLSRVDAPRRSNTGDIGAYRPSLTIAPARRPARGRSLVNGEEPSPLLLERRKRRDEERRQGRHSSGNTAKVASELPARAASPPGSEAPPRGKPQAQGPPSREPKGKPQAGRLEKRAPEKGGHDKPEDKPDKRPKGKTSPEASSDDTKGLPPGPSI